MKNKTRKSLTLALLCACMLSTPTVKSFAMTSEAVTLSKASEDATEVGSRFFELIFGKKDKEAAPQALRLCPGGDAFGIKISGSGVTVSKIIKESASSPLCIDDKI